ncbi:MAG: NAD(P)H-dependent glycerol-3-phosphate dehydrogenase [Ilumatobacteraceae bacterium]
MQVTVLGAGSWGTTMASLIAGRHATMIWARSPETAAEIDGRHTNEGYLPGFTLPEQLIATDDLEKAMRHAELLILGVPTTAMRSTIKAAREFIHPWIPIVSLAKGLEQQTLLRMTEVIQEEVPGHPVAALSGPNIAREIMAGQAAASVLATEDLSVAAAIQKVLTRGLFRIYTNHDVIGCEIGGALKNVVAIACGIAQGLGVGDNTRAMVMTRGLAELTRLGVALGGEAPTFAGLAGMGDLVTTCISPHSRNRMVGEQLGLGRKLEEIVSEMSMVAEGVKTSVTARELAKRHDVPMPVCDEIYRVVRGRISVDRAYRGLRLRPGHESDPG